MSWPPPPPPPPPGPNSFPSDPQQQQQQQRWTAPPPSPLGHPQPPQQQQQQWGYRPPPPPPPPGAARAPPGGYPPPQQQQQYPLPPSNYAPRAAAGPPPPPRPPAAPFSAPPNMAGAATRVGYPVPPPPPMSASAGAGFSQGGYSHGMAAPPPPPPGLGNLPPPGPASSYNGAARMPPPPPLPGMAPPGPQYSSRPPPLPQQPMTALPVISTLPTPDPPSKPHLQSRMALEVYYPKAHFCHGTSSQMAPPSSAFQRSIVLDDGNASPHCFSSVFGALPQDSTILKRTGISQMQLQITPLNLPSQSYLGRVGMAEWLPESGRLGYVALDTSTATTGDVAVFLPPPRCTRCQSYATAFQTGDSCILCGSRMNSASARVSTGTVEYPVSGPYVTRSTPVQPHVLFAVDMTTPNCMDYLQLVLDEVLPQWVHAQQSQGQTTRTAIVLVTGRGIYIPLVASTNETCFICMPDVLEEPFCPLPLVDWTWDLSTEWTSMYTVWQELLQTKVPQLLEQVQSDKLQGGQVPGYSVSCGGAAMAFLVDALRETGGRAIFLSWRRPNYGAGKLADRLSTTKPENDNLLYLPNRVDMFYKNLATQAATAHVAVDFVLHTDPDVPRSYLDVATLQQICQTTNGRLTWISEKHWKECFVQTLLRPLAFSGWDAVLKIRVSSGVRVKNLDSAVGIIRTSSRSLSDIDSPELELAVVTPDTTIGIELEHRVGGLPRQATFVYVQSALLYSDPWSGQRRVRVSTLALRVAPTVPQAMRSIDFGTYAACLVRHVASMVRNQPKQSTEGEQVLQQVRHYLMESCVGILAAHRQYGGAASASPSQLLLPEKLTLLPLLVLSLFKSPLLRAAVPPRTVLSLPTPDERAYWLANASQTGPAMAFWLVYPLLVDLHSPTLQRLERPGLHLPEDAHRLDILKHAPYVQLPDPMVPSIAVLEDDHAYLLVTGLGMYVLVGRDCTTNVDEWHQAAAVARGELTKEDLEVTAKEGGITTNLLRAVAQVRVWSQVGCEPRWLRPTWDSVEVVQRHEECQTWMVGDVIAKQLDYGSFLAELHRRVTAVTSSK